MRAWTVLIVDDNPQFLDELRSELEASDLFSQILTAADGRTALRLATEQEIGLVLVDLLMPGMNGIATTCALHRARPALPILLMSTEPGGRTIFQAAQQAGAQAFLPKAALSPSTLLDFFPC
jgi:DNA-binding NarL/FixJ family response regulator